MFSIDKALVTTSKNKFNENTPLHLAAEAGHVDAVRIMIENGVSAVDENLDGFTPVQISARCGHGDVFEEFANSGKIYLYFLILLELYRNGILFSLYLCKISVYWF